jgi:hypothetical protein
MSTQCTAKSRKGKRCRAWAITGKTKCALHFDPGRAAKLGAKHGRGALEPPDPDARPLQAPKTANDVRDALAETMAAVQARARVYGMDAKLANTLAYVGSALLRAVEIVTSRAE